MTSVELLEPGQSIRPTLTLTQAEGLLTKLYGYRCVSIGELDGYDDRNFKVTVRNSCHNGTDEEVYVLKVLNSLDSRKTSFIEAQNELLLYLSNNNISCPIPIPNIEGSYYSIEDLESGKHIVRLMKYLPGITLLKVPDPPTSLFTEIGAFAAKLDKVMQVKQTPMQSVNNHLFLKRENFGPQKFHHPAYATHRTLWMLESVPQVRNFLFAVRDEEKRVILEEIIQEFEEKVLTKVDKLEKGLIHGDINEQNIIVREVDGEWKMTSILDYGDSQYSCYLFELVIAMTYVMILTRRVNAGGYVLRGYSKIRKIPAEELDMLKICIEARVCQSLVMGAYSNMQDPENEYVLTTSKPGWELLFKLRSMRKDNLLSNWRKLLIEE